MSDKKEHIIDPAKLKSGDVIVLIRDKNGKLHPFGGSLTSVQVVRKGVFGYDIMAGRDTYEGTTEIGLTINEKI